MKKAASLSLVFLVLFALSSCRTTPVPENIEPQSLFHFATRAATEEREDGWVYHFEYSHPLEGASAVDSDVSYGYDATNLKYKHIEGYDIPIIDEETSEIVDYATSAVPYLLLNQSLRPELERINAFFMEKKYTAPIALAELEGLQIEQIKKEDVLRLFNRAMEQGDLEPGKYVYLPASGILQESSVLSGYQWQVGYLIMHGNIANLRIELLYDGVTHLSDLVEDGKANDHQKAIQQKIQMIQKQILERQSFTTANESPAPVIETVQFERLFTLLQRLEDQNRRPE